MIHRLGRAGVVAGWLVLSAVAVPAQAQAAPPAGVTAAPQPVTLDAALRELQRLLAERAALQGVQQRAEAESAREAAEIERLKGQAPGVARDLQLQERLAQAEARAGELSRRAAALRAQGAAVAGARQRVIQVCDQLLQGTLATTLRLELLRLRAAQVDQVTDELAAAPRGAGAAALQTAERAGRGDGGMEGGNDDPQVLRERADLLRDSADKLRKELQRLEERSAELQRRRRLQERAAAVDDDLFAEQTVNRRAGGQSDKTSQGGGTAAGPVAGNAGNPALPVNAPGGGGTPTATLTAPVAPGSPFLSGLDPATLELLRGAGGPAEPSEPEARLQALRRAQGELRRILDQIGRRAAALEQRSRALQRQK